MSVTSLFRAEMGAAIAAALVLGLLLLVLRPRDRRSTRNALILLGICALAEAADGFIVSMGGRAAAAIAADVASVLVGAVLIRLAMIFVFRVVVPAFGAHPPSLLEDLSTAGLVLAWGLVWLRLSGVDLASLVATSAVITGVLAFSMQETLGNVLGGVLLQIDQSIRIGDWVRIDDNTSGRVVEIGWRCTAVETRNRETVMVPNGWLMKNRFVVIGSRADPQPLWRRTVMLNVELAAKPSAVCDVLERAIADAAIPEVAKAPPPSAVLLEVQNGYGRYGLRYWLADPMLDDPTDSHVRHHAMAALERHGMRLGVPQEERLVTQDDARRESERAIERERRLAALAKVDLFASLSKTERETLADHLVYTPFVAGDVITRQGAIAHWLYLIISGTADVWVEAPEGRKLVAALQAGEVAGEMGMMTGEARRATVTAKSDVVCYRLDKAGFETIIKARPDIAASISKVLASRAASLRVQRELLAISGRAAPQHDDILARIRDFFGLTQA